MSAEALASLIRSSGPVAVLTGAGVSVPSGIPDFRTPGTGEWANVDPMKVAHISVWERDPERFWAFYGRRFALLEGKEPNGAHLAIAELERRGLVSGVITQNIDGLHAAAGSDPIEVHGSMRTSSCRACGASYSLAEVRARGAVPRCDCGEVLKPDVVLFGEFLPEQAMLRASALAQAAGLMLVVGSSLEVWPIAGLPAETLDAGGKLAIVTAGETRYDAHAEVKLTGDVVAELEAVVALLGGV